MTGQAGAAIFANTAGACLRRQFKSVLAYLILAWAVLLRLARATCPGGPLTFGAMRMLHLNGS